LRIIRAEKAGFCFGVKRAIDMAEKAIANDSAASLGPLIHNQQVVDYLKGKGIEVTDSLDQLKTGQQLIIRSHGVPPRIYSEAEKKGIKIVDATCPYVQKAQGLAAKSSRETHVIVIGDKNHPEVIGLLGWAGDNSQAIETIDEARSLPFYPSIAVLAQTTLPMNTFTDITEELRLHTNNLLVHNTICRATEERQASAHKLSEKVDVMIVVGGRTSSNTRKLRDICCQKTKTYLIETVDELQEIWFRNATSVGLTAGASTPDWIIEEVYTKMSDIIEKTNEALEDDPTVEKLVETSAEGNNDENMMSNFDSEFPKIYGGAIVKGTVVKISGDEVFVDISWKSEGVIPIEELSSTKVTDINDIVKVGDTVTVMVTRVENNEGYTMLSRRRASEIEAREKLAELAQTKEEVQAKVTEVIKGGLLVDLGMRGFVPASQVDVGYVDDLSKYVGQTLRLRIIEFDASKRKLVLSQKAILAEEQKEKREKLFETLKEGDVVKGTVRRLATFGAFVDIGGIDGLLHVSDMAFSRINHPSEVVNVDDEVDVQVLNIDREKAKISLGLKQMRNNPWSNINEKYPEGSIVKGKVVRIAPFGAFVQLEDGVDALVHISQLANQRVNRVEDIVKVGDEVSAKVIECKPEEKRISLSIKETLVDSQKAEEQEALESQQEVSEVTIGDVVGDINQSDNE